MSRIAKIFTNGRSQAVRLPVDFRFDTDQVYIKRDEVTGNVVLSKKPDSWDDFFKILKDANIPQDFLSKRDKSPTQKRKLF